MAIGYWWMAVNVDNKKTGLSRKSAKCQAKRRIQWSQASSHLSIQYTLSLYRTPTELASMTIY